ncbi:MAG: class A beta-lactamase-related serine hydrolase [Betaproteobacteria bacterium]|nr:class A beta-lactamase-related serine hydrolase [Betaproteobacteria bacterium]
MPKPRAYVLLWTLAAAACGDAWSRGSTEELLTALEAARLSQGVAGASFAIVTPGAVLRMGGVGVMDWEKPTPATEDTLFRIGSVTKVFTASVLLQMQQEGNLKLAGKVRQHAPLASYINPWEAAHPLRIEHLLEHTAGLQDLTKEEFDSSDPKPLTLEEGLALRPDSRTVRWQPGMHSSYSNSGYGLAGYVIEQVLKQRYEDAVQIRLFDPLGMKSSGFFQDDASRARLATGYQPDGKTPLRYWHMIMRPFGGIHTSARDMVPFLQMMLKEGRHADKELLSPESIRRMETPLTTLAARSGLRFGYGLGVHHYLYRGFVFLGHGGDADGYLAHFGYNRSLGTAYFIAINRFHWSALRALRRVIEAWITEDALPSVPPPEMKLTQDQLREYTGRYEAATSRFTQTSAAERSQQIVRVVYADGRLYTETANGSRDALIAVTPRHFRREGEPEATAAFVYGEDGKLYFQEDENLVRVPEP